MTNFEIKMTRQKSPFFKKLFFRNFIFQITTFFINQNIHFLLKIDDFCKTITILSQKELENEIMSTVQQYPELMSAMKSYNENHDFEKVSEHLGLPLKTEHFYRTFRRTLVLDFNQ